MQAYLRMGDQLRREPDPELYRASKESHFETALVPVRHRDTAPKRNATATKTKRQAKKAARKKQR